MLPTGPKIFINRFKDCWRASPPLFFQGVFYTVCLELFAALGLQHILRHNRDEIEHLMALLSGPLLWDPDAVCTPLSSTPWLPYQKATESGKPQEWVYNTVLGGSSP